MGVFDLNQQEYNLKLAEALKKIPEFKKPEWVEFVKSSSGKERPIDDEDFWHKRAASILKQIYKNKIKGVNRLKIKYGTKKNRGMKPEKFRKGSGKIIRVILQQSDNAGLTEIIKAQKGTKIKSGRQMTEKGKEFMEGIN
ncbi:30S ribosomal protein S19e [Candidatus Pacearchaeota archaeon CG10_big_fil_rev_8_21_14_0_10_34_12]|nr:MAG: 30S ribosomal protein S19e [Candidatus Pacearchaeota archaeon CG10_big_fil_rev_8_21_14_0_10_34_12]